MKSYITTAACLALAAIAAPQAATAQQVQAAAPAPSPESLAVAREIVAIAWPPEKHEASMNDIMNTLLSQYKSSISMEEMNDPGIKAIMDDYFRSIPDMLRASLQKFLPIQMEAIATAYARIFPLQQLKDVRTFAQSASGRDYIQRSTTIMSDPDVAAANTAYFKDVHAATEQSLPALKARIFAYIAAHPEVAAKMKAQAQAAAKR